MMGRAATASRAAKSSAIYAASSGTTIGIGPADGGSLDRTKFDN
jgi:hypothetical protein